MRTEHKRVKHGEQPGDVHRRRKIQMRETRGPIEIDYGGHTQVVSEAACKTFRKYLREKGRTVQRQRDKRQIKQGLEEA